MKMIKKVLVVEDGELLQKLCKKALGGKVKIVSAFSIEEAEEKFATNPDIIAIVMDGRVPGGEPNTESPNTEPLVRKFRTTFAGPMLATSSNPMFCQKLVKAGCDYECDKVFVPQKLCEILGL